MIQAIPLILSWSAIHLPALGRKEGEEIASENEWLIITFLQSDVM